MGGCVVEIAEEGLGTGFSFVLSGRKMRASISTTLCVAGLEVEETEEEDAIV